MEKVDEREWEWKYENLTQEQQLLKSAHKLNVKPTEIVFPGSILTCSFAIAVNDHNGPIYPVNINECPVVFQNVKIQAPKTGLSINCYDENKTFNMDENLELVNKTISFVNGQALDINNTNRNPVIINFKKTIKGLDVKQFKLTFILYNNSSKIAEVTLNAIQKVKRTLQNTETITTKDEQPYKKAKTEKSKTAAVTIYIENDSELGTFTVEDNKTTFRDLLTDIIEKNEEPKNFYFFRRYEDKAITFPPTQFVYQQIITNGYKPYLARKNKAIK